MLFQNRWAEGFLSPWMGFLTKPGSNGNSNCTGYDYVVFSEKLGVRDRGVYTLDRRNGGLVN